MLSTGRLPSHMCQTHCCWNGLRGAGKECTKLAIYYATKHNRFLALTGSFNDLTLLTFIEMEQHPDGNHGHIAQDDVPAVEF